MEIAAHFLGTRPRTRRELELRLRRSGTTDEVIAATLERLEALGLVDDVAFARWWAEQRDRHAPRGRRMVEAELRQRGVPREVMEALRGEELAEPALDAEAIPGSEAERAGAALDTPSQGPAHARRPAGGPAPGCLPDAARLRPGDGARHAARCGRDRTRRRGRLSGYSSAHDALRPDDRAPAGAQLRRDPGPGPRGGGGRAGGVLPLGPLRLVPRSRRPADHRRVGHPGRAGARDEHDPDRLARLAGHLPRSPAPSRRWWQPSTR